MMGKNGALSWPIFGLLLGLVVLTIHGTSLGVSANPLPDQDKIKEEAESFWEKVEDFFDRLWNTITFNVDDQHKGVSTLELVISIAVAVIVLLIIPCCICFCLCECVKELVCCICCCSWCRD